MGILKQQHIKFLPNISKMVIAHVSSVVENLLYTGIFQSLNDTTLLQVANVQDLPENLELVDLIFFDASLGLESIRQQVSLSQQTNKLMKWLVIEEQLYVQQSLQYLHKGAAGILVCPNEATLNDCLQSISQDQLYLDAQLIQIIAFRQIKKAILPFKLLTAREYDVFCLLAEGYSVLTIADLLSITCKTAYNSQTQIRKKLGLNKQQQICALAEKHGLINSKKL